MELNYNSGHNGKRVQSDEVIGMSVDIHDMKETDIAKDAYRFVNKKEGMGEHTKLEKMPRDAKSAAAERRAFRSLHKRESADSPKGTVGPMAPMEIRIKQLSLFPGIY